MKTIIILIIIVAASFFGYKYFFSEKLQISPQGPPQISPQISPQSSPPRLAPPGTFYVKDKISITTEDGITSLPPGKKVTLVRESGNSIVVTDGIQEFDVARSSLTNDLDILDGITTSHINRQKNIEANAASRSKNAIEEIKKWEEGIQNEQRRLQLENAEMNIAAERMNRELEDAKRAPRASLTKAPTKVQYDLEQKIAAISKKLTQNNDQITDMQLILAKARLQRQSK